ncbi:MAG TPA: energy transducer TonB [Terriglobales bacterium]|nr:energy transducer TonB [Terriglobales bacterium]
MTKTCGLVLFVTLLSFPALLPAQQNQVSASAEHTSNLSDGTPEPTTIVPGHLSYNPAPKYPDATDGQEMEGTVLLDATISKDGRVTNVGIESGDLALADAAVDAIREWKFGPYTRAGSPVEVWQQLEFRFAPGQASPTLSTPLSPPVLATSLVSPQKTRPPQGVQTAAIGHGVRPPKVIFAPDPEYTKAAKEAKYQGTCILSLIIGSDGKPHEIHVVRAIGMGLDPKAVDTVSTWKFEPATKDGLPVATFVQIEVSFHLY